MKRCFWVSILGLWFVVGACTSVTLRQAVQFERDKRYPEAEQAYKRIAEAEGSDAVQAQAALVRGLTKRNRWSSVPSEAAQLGSFLDPESQWYQRYRKKSSTWKAATKQIKQTLLACARSSHRKAKVQGDPKAYIAMGRLYGLYLEHYTQGEARAEAALGRGIVLAIRSSCREAIVWFHRSAKWSGAEAKAQSDAQKIVLRSASRNALGCRFQLWQKQQESQKGVKVERLVGEEEEQVAFSALLKESETLLRLDPKNAPTALLRYTQRAKQMHRYSEALTLLLLVIRTIPEHPASAIVRREALSLFGMTKNWKPLIAHLQNYLKGVPFQKRDRFWKRVQELTVVNGLREASGLLKNRQKQQAIQRLLVIYRYAPQNPRSVLALFQASVVMEQLNQKVQARKHFLALCQKHPKHRLADRAMFRYAVLLREKKPKRAAWWFMTLGRRYPKSVIASRSLYRAMKIYQELGDQKRIKQLRKKILRKYPASMEAKRIKRGG